MNDVDDVDDDDDDTSINNTSTNAKLIDVYNIRNMTYNHNSYYNTPHNFIEQNDKCYVAFDNFINKNSESTEVDSLSYLPDIEFIYYNKDKCMIMYKMGNNIFFLHLQAYYDNEHEDTYNYEMNCTTFKKIKDSNFMVNNVYSPEGVAVAEIVFNPDDG